MPRITISYRREDSAAITGRIFDRLEMHYGKNSVFMDVDAIPLGVDFRDYIEGALKTTDYLLVIIGSRWLGPRDDGTRRLDDETDPVRLEVDAALRNDSLTVIPVLVEGTKMPSPAVLPPELGKLSFINAADIASGTAFNAQVDRLIRFLDAAIAKRAAEDAERAKGEAARAAEEAARARDQERKEREERVRRQIEERRKKRSEPAPPPPRRNLLIGSALVLVAGIVAVGAALRGHTVPAPSATATATIDLSILSSFPLASSSATAAPSAAPSPAASALDLKNLILRSPFPPSFLTPRPLAASLFRTARPSSLVLAAFYTKLQTAAGKPNIYYEVDTCRQQGPNALVTFHVYNESSRSLHFSTFEFGKWKSPLERYVGFTVPPYQTSSSHTDQVKSFTCGSDRVALGLSGITYSGG